MDKVVTLEEILSLTKQLSLVDKVRLNEQIAGQIKRDLQAAQVTLPKSLRGLWAGVDITESDIAEARNQMWGNFPREDI
jgi:hypothetical protein